MRRLVLLAHVALAACGAAPAPAPAPRVPASDPAEARRAELRAEEEREEAARLREDGTCDDESFDLHRVACRDYCPSFYVAAAAGCDSKCPPGGAAPSIPACRGVMACPSPPDRRVVACVRDAARYWPDCDRARPAIANPRCDGTSPVPGSLTSYTAGADGRFELHIAPCADRGVAPGWRGHLRDARSGSDVPGTDLVVEATDRDDCRAITTSAVDPAVVERSTRVWMSP